MKNRNKGIASLALAVVIVGGVFAGTASAANTEDSKNPEVGKCVECVECVENLDALYDEYVKAGTITQAEADKLKAVYDEMDKLYENIGEDTTDEEFEAIDEKAEKLYESVEAIEDKIFAAEEKEYYDGLVKDGTLTQKEADKLKAAYDEMNKLYENVSEDTAYEEIKVIDEKADKLLESVEAIENKIYEADEKNYYDGLVEDGTITQAEADKLKSAYEEIDKIYAEADEKADKVYSGIQAIEEKINDGCFEGVDEFGCTASDDVEA